MDDIEDMVSQEDVSRSEMAASRAYVVLPNVEKIQSTDCTKTSSNVPGTQLIWLKTYGCSHNVSDSEYMQGILSSYGYNFTDVPEDAQLWLLNSCTVKDPSQAAFMHLATKGKSLGKAVVVAGCVPQADRNLKGLEEISIVGIQQVDRVVEVVEETLKGHTVRLLAKKDLPQLDLPKIRKNPMVEIIPLSTGCLGACTYCKTRHSRGKLGSYTIEAIVARAEQVIQQGVTEIWLSSEDTGAYGIDLGTDLPTLLYALLAILPENVMLRVGMTNPPYILGHLEAIAKVLQHPSVYAFLHVPVQSGSNAVLKEMNREYTREEFCKVADFLLANVPGLTLATDIICGFPGETEADFEETMSLCEQYRFHIMNISQFYPRPGTPAAKMTRVPTQVVKNRSRKLTKLFSSIDPYPEMNNTVQKIWINTEISDDGKFTIGHTKNYTKVLVPRDDKLMGCTAQVQITSTSRFHITGNVLSKSKPVTAAATGVQDNVRLTRSTNSNKSSLKSLNTLKNSAKTACSPNCENGQCVGEETTKLGLDFKSKEKVQLSWQAKWDAYKHDRITMAAATVFVASISIITARMLFIRK